MKTDGRAITKMMKQVQALAKNIDSFIGTANAMMSEAGWTPITSTCTATSRTPGNHDWWFPLSVFQFYAHKEPAHASLLPYCATVLLPRSGTLEEPMATSGCINYGAGKSVGKNYYSDWAEVHLWTPNPALDGKKRTTLRKDINPKPSIPFLAVTSLAVPMVSITDPDGIKDSLIDPTLHMVQQFLEGNQ